MIDIPKFATKEETFKFIKDNEDKIIAQKKSAIKHADAFTASVFHVEKDGSIIEASKAYNIVHKASGERKPIMVKAIINTTNIMDSHSDVHWPKLWNKSLKESKLFSLVKEHNFTFDGTITDDVKASAVKYPWRDLGYKIEGITEALVFDSIIMPDDKTGMYERYLKGVVKNHSVGMRYVKMYTCINSDKEYYEKEKENWDKYFPGVVNSDDAEEQGYFWAVVEAKVIEGSAVKRGSNIITPTYSVTEIEEDEDKSWPDDSTTEQPPFSTVKTFDWSSAIANHNFLKI